MMCHYVSQPSETQCNLSFVLSFSNHKRQFKLFCFMDDLNSFLRSDKGHEQSTSARKICKTNAYNHCHSVNHYYCYRHRSRNKPRETIYNNQSAKSMLDSTSTTNCWNPTWLYHQTQLPAKITICKYYVFYSPYSLKKTLHFPPKFGFYLEFDVYQ